jgi:hypothetical protein
MQYTLRNIPKQIDTEVRRRAHEERKSMNRALLEALARGVGLQGEVQRQRDLSDIAGTWKKDPAFDQAVAEQDGRERPFPPTTSGSRPSCSSTV